MSGLTKDIAGKSVNVGNNGGNTCGGREMAGNTICAAHKLTPAQFSFDLKSAASEETLANIGIDISSAPGDYLRLPKFALTNRYIFRENTRFTQKIM